MGIFSRLLKSVLINVLQDFDSLKNDWNNQYKSKRSYSKEDFNYYYKKYQDYYNKSHGKTNYDYYYKNTASNFNHEEKKIAQYYANLEVPYGAGLEEVKKSWKNLLKKYHPDVHMDEDKKLKATILTQKLNEAYFKLEKYLKEKENQ